MYREEVFTIAGELLYRVDIALALARYHLFLDERIRTTRFLVPQLMSHTQSRLLIISKEILATAAIEFIELKARGNPIGTDREREERTYDKQSSSRTEHGRGSGRKSDRVLRQEGRRRSEGVTEEDRTYKSTHTRSSKLQEERAASSSE